jgi:hypothetical protein
MSGKTTTTTISAEQYDALVRYASDNGVTFADAMRRAVATLTGVEIDDKPKVIKPKVIKPAVVRPKVITKRDRPKKTRQRLSPEERARVRAEVGRKVASIMRQCPLGCGYVSTPGGIASHTRACDGHPKQRKVASGRTQAEWLREWNGRKTREQQSEFSRRGWITRRLTQTPAEIAASRHRAWDTIRRRLTPEQISEMTSRRRKTPEERSINYRRAWEKRRLVTTHEQFSEASRKGWLTRRRNAEAKENDRREQ